MPNPPTKDALRVDVGLLWHTFQSANLGCGALSICNTAIIENAARRAGLRPVFHIFGTGDRTLNYYYANSNFETVTNLTLRPLLTRGDQLREAMEKCDILFDASAGDSFTDQYGWKRFMMMCMSKLMAARTEKPLILAPQTIGPFTTPYSKALARIVLNRCTLVFPRDELSSQQMDDLGVECRRSLSTDVAFRLPYLATGTITSGTDGPLKIGINVSALLSYRGSATIPLSLSYRDLIEAIIVHLTLTRPDAEIHLVPHVLAQGHAFEDDMKACKELKTRHPQLIIASEFTNPIEAKSYISNLDLLLASRMHAAIAALSADVPVLPLSYSRKFTGLFSGIGYPYLADLTSITSVEAVIQMLDAVLLQLPQVRQIAQMANAEAQSRLTVYQRFIEEWMESFAWRAVRSMRNGPPIAAST